MCDWAKEDLEEAKTLVNDTLNVLKDIKVEEGNTEVMVDAVTTLTSNPDMISNEAAVTALTVLDAGGDNELTPDTANNAVSAVSSILAASDNNISQEITSGGDNIEAKKKLKQMSAKIMKVASKILDAVPLDGADYVVDAPLLKAKKTAIDVAEPLQGAASDGTGLEMSENELIKLDTGDEMNAQMVSFAINTYKHNDEVAKKGCGGTASVNIKRGKTRVSVADSAVTVKVVVNLGEDEEAACTYWAGEGPSTKGC